MDDYAAIVSRDTFNYRLIQTGGERPYWVTNSGDGRYCFVSFSGNDRVWRRIGFFRTPFASFFPGYSSSPLHPLVSSGSSRLR